MEPNDYKNRTYLSSLEAGKYLGISVEEIHRFSRQGFLNPLLSASGQMRFALKDLQKFEKEYTPPPSNRENKISTRNYTNEENNMVYIGDTVQRVLIKSSANMGELKDNSVHLMITSPPYFDTKMYAREPIEGDLGNIHNMEEWFSMIGKVWKEVYRVLQPGRKAFINIMNLPIRLEGGGYRTLNLVGKTVDLCESIGFIFKRDIVWQKTNAVRAHFGTYPYPGGILINNMHEFILEFDKPMKKGTQKYAHLTPQQKEDSRLEKDFWIEIKKSDVWLMKPQGSGDRRNHIAPFPYQLPYRLIKAFSYVSETVLDPFVGSGTTLLACAELKRNGIGFEINSEIGGETLNRLKEIEKRNA